MRGSILREEAGRDELAERRGVCPCEGALAGELSTHLQLPYVMLQSFYKAIHVMDGLVLNLRPLLLS